MASYLVTGGCGFIGSHLCDALVGKGHEVRVLDDLSTGKRENLPDPARLIVGDVGDVGIVRDAMRGMDGCFHLAAVASVERSIRDWPGTHRTNLTGAINVFDAACSVSRSPVPVVYASSAAVYGDNASVPLTERAAPRPLTPYGADKLGCELNARVASLVFGVPTVGFRFFNVFGPRQDPASPYSGVISIFADRCLGNQPLAIHGDGEQTRDFVYVGDVIDFLLAAIERRPSGAEVFNVCTGKPTSVSQLAAVIASIVGARPAIEFRPARPGDIRHSVGDPGKALRGLGVEPTVDLGQGLRWTMASLREQRARAAAATNRRAVTSPTRASAANLS